jgi:20S proteasome alpha/beta subunit
VCIKKDYKAINSGAKFAYLIFNQLNRLLTASIEKISNLSLEVVIGLASYIINGVKEIDPKCGWLTQIAVIDKNGYREIMSEEQSSCYDIMIDKFSNLPEKISDIKEIARIFLSNNQPIP